MMKTNSFVPSEKSVLVFKKVLPDSLAYRLIAKKSFAYL
jgi:hypothetical protein